MNRGRILDNKHRKKKKKNNENNPPLPATSGLVVSGKLLDIN